MMYVQLDAETGKYLKIVVTHFPGFYGIQDVELRSTVQTEVRTHIDLPAW
jgi:hypothetical protein